MEITPEMQALIDAEVAKRLSEIKGKLDKVYAQRDELQVNLDAAKRAATEKEAEHQTALAKALTDARNAGDATANELKARVEQLETHNSNLSRDSLIGTTLGGFSFRSGRAAEVARDELAKLLVKGKDGWATADGRAVDEVAKELFAKEDMAFLMKPAVSTGAGGNQAPNTPSKDSGSLLGKSNEELIAQYSRK